jgi:undecaprenyl-diphosphatase
MPSLDQRQLPRAQGSSDEDVFPDALLLTVAAVAGAIAAIITAVVYAGLTTTIDEALFDFVHGGETWTPSTAPLWWNEAVRDVTALGGAIVLTAAVAASCTYLLAARRHRLFMLLLVSAAGATLLSTTVKIGFGRARPQTVEHLVLTSSASFPSGHALLSAAIILTIGGLMAFAAARPSERRVIMTTALLVCFGVGLSRVWLGVHWPSDVLAGWMFGGAWAAMTLWLAKRIDRQGQRRGQRAGDIA